MSILREALEADELEGKANSPKHDWHSKISHVGGALNKGTTVIIRYPIG